jgi:beta-glucosidase
MTQMDYAYAPEALESTLRYAWKRSGGRPLIVTENGIGTADDHRRIEFTNTAVRGVRSCLKDGVDVRGYVHWSLLDNFEWESGYKITFGLVQVDRKTFRRIPKRSARHFGALARSNGARLG